MSAPKITKAAWTFTLRSECVFCGKPVTRQRTYYAATERDAGAQAEASEAAGIWHRKCGMS